MEIRDLFLALLALSSGVLGWFLRTLYDTIEALKKELWAHKEDVAKTYATKLDLIRFENKLDTILNKIDGKADK